MAVWTLRRSPRLEMALPIHCGSLAHWTPCATRPLYGRRKVDPELERSAKDQYMNYLQDNTNLENEMK